MDATNTSHTPLPSPLYKPLHELTEDDIAQVTREDCRRFLKEKGMRRPSWNKSQAIQQVISLKALLEAKPLPDDDGGDPTAPFPKRRATADGPFRPVASAPPPPPPAAPPPPGPGEEPPYRRREPQAFVHGELSCRLPEAAGEGEAPPYRRREPQAFVHGEPSCRLPEAAGGVPSRLPAAGVRPQMTIFYGGAVHVYDGMPLEKAATIMKVAASREASREFVPQLLVHTSRPLALWQPQVPPMCHLPAPLPHATPYSDETHEHSWGRRPITAAVGMVRFPYHQQREGTEDWRSSRETEPEGTTGRRASLQRYLEKRKDRKLFKCKRSIDGLAPSDFELYLSQKLKPHLLLGQQCLNDTISLIHPLHPSTPMRSCFVENQGQTVRLSIDLNDDDVQEV